MCTLTLTGDSSELSCDIFPPIEVKRDSKLCLLSLHTNNSIPNIEQGCNTIAFKSKSYNNTIVIPVGTYELDSLETFIKKKLPNTSEFVLISDNNTLKCIMKCDYDIDFTIKDNISKLLGFDNKVYAAKTEHESTNIINIMKVISIKVDCNLISGSFNNGVPDQAIHEFSPSVAPGFKIIEVPLQSVYYPLIDCSIGRVQLTLRDQNNDLINLRGEPITIRLQIK